MDAQEEPLTEKRTGKSNTSDHFYSQSRSKDCKKSSSQTASDIPKGKIYDIMKELDKVTMKAPVAIGDVVIPNVLGLGVDVVACKK